MISPDTAPGTLVVCLDPSPGPFGPTPLKRGGCYTIKGILPSNDSFVATLMEFPPMMFFSETRGMMELGYSLKRFRYLRIPRTLTSLLTSNPEWAPPDDLDGRAPTRKRLTRPPATPRRVKRGFKLG